MRKMPSRQRKLHYKRRKRTHFNQRESKLWQKQQMMDCTISMDTKSQTIKEQLLENSSLQKKNSHETKKPDLKTTPVRIVFNSSASYMAYVLNECWAKGLDLLNNILAILYRWLHKSTRCTTRRKRIHTTTILKWFRMHMECCSGLWWRNWTLKLDIRYFL